MYQNLIWNSTQISYFEQNQIYFFRVNWVDYIQIINCKNNIDKIN